ncbi:uncharacterized protein LOC130920385 isoform X4 [Corythoichthys intestinalis]|uniref:uncharacterized protein LOC130920385 isoform X4 n=1 Tax=Corythoichthys intestinalis TaxID=161448 RepID=UPI0025A682AD|nr:uncharacterized protein LOC130920385 isoform X4 [Corythoichthys intestinalis]
MPYIKLEEEPETPSIKEEEEEDEITKYPITVCVKSEDDEGSSEESGAEEPSCDGSFQHLTTKGEGQSHHEDAGNSLDVLHKSRYVEKLQSIQSPDPYLMPKSMFFDPLSSPSLPDISYPDIYNYLVHTKSAYSHESLKNLKSLEAYKHFVAGWVKQVLVHKNSAGIYLVLGKVVHSQHLSETPQSPWFAAQPSGTILCGHCTCMAGLGETCSHVTSVMFAVETAVKMKNDTTSTSVSCSWQAPSQTQNVEYSRSSDMDLTSPPAKKRKCAGESVTSVTPGEQELQPPQDYTDFYRKLHFSGVKPVVLSVLPDYCEEFVPKTVKLGLPKPMSSVFMETHVSKSLDELTAEASTDDSQISAVKQMTREQSTTKSRFLNRAGRITASNFKAASRTEIENPSNSLIQRVCYPDTFKFTTEATRFNNRKCSAR